MGCVQLKTAYAFAPRSTTMPTANILDEPLRTTKQVAARWQTSEETVRRKFRAEAIRGVKIGGRLRFSLKEILKAEGKREV